VVAGTAVPSGSLEAQRLAQVDTGVVVGPRVDVGALDASRRVRCRLRDIEADILAADLWPVHRVLAGGLHVGDQVVCLIDHKSFLGAVSFGDIGTVWGPSRDAKAAHFRHRVNVAFPNQPSINLNHKELWNCSAPLAGGLYVGDEVVCLVNHLNAEGCLSWGDVGIARGPSTKPRASDTSERLNCQFPGHPNVNVLQQSVWKRGAPLCGSLQFGDEVTALRDFAGTEGKVWKGNRGQIRGPCTKTGLSKNRVNCSFPNHSSLNAPISWIWRVATPLVGGFGRRGDHVKRELRDERWNGGQGSDW